MPTLLTDDGVRLYYEEAGSGTPIVFVHEFAGDYRSWEAQMQHFSRRYRCIAYNARGYPPSEVPDSAERYSQARARDDIRAVLDGLELPRAHVVGLSMGAFATLHFAMAYGSRTISATVAGCGYGAHPATHAKFQEDSRALAQEMLAQGMAYTAAGYGHGPARVQLQEKNPRGFAQFVKNFSEHSALGSANTMLGYQARRPSLYALAAELGRVDVPMLVVAGDEDEGALEASLFLKRAIATAALAVLPKSGHMPNLEEPARFCALLDDFFHQVESGRWTRRDERAMPASLYGPGGKP